jgi:hypothetical protein
MTRPGQAHGARASDPDPMSYNTSLDEIVLFELPTQEASESLVMHLGQTRLAWLQSGEGGSVVGVLLNPDDGDLALLLRGVETWVDQSGFAAIRFEVDGRTYVLESKQTVVPLG